MIKQNQNQTRLKNKLNHEHMQIEIEEESSKTVNCATLFSFYSNDSNNTFAFSFARFVYLSHHSLFFSLISFSFSFQVSDLKNNAQQFQCATSNSLIKHI